VVRGSPRAVRLQSARPLSSVRPVVEGGPQLRQFLVAHQHDEMCLGQPLPVLRVEAGRTERMANRRSCGRHSPGVRTIQSIFPVFRPFYRVAVDCDHAARSLRNSAGSLASVYVIPIHCQTISWSFARPSVSAAGPGCKIRDDLISYTSWCRTAGVRSKPGRAIPARAGTSCRTRSR
jgi:hypothetical protein